MSNAFTAEVQEAADQLIRKSRMANSGVLTDLVMAAIVLGQRRAAAPALGITTGPWKIDDGLSCQHGGYDSGVRCIVATGDRPVICTTSRGWADGGAESVRNATAIAALPDLVGALKMCVIERDEWLAEALAALAKAGCAP